MGSKLRILVLGSSTAGGDWPPSACVAKGLRVRGHEVCCFGDSAIATSSREMDIPVIAVDEERELMAYFLRWMAGLGGAEITPEYLERNPPLTGWSNEVLPTASEVAEQFQPDLILSQLFCLELASLLSSRTRRPWCFINPGVYFGPGTREVDLDYAGFGRYFFRLFPSLVESASLVLHGTDPVFDPPPPQLPAHHHYVGPLLGDISAACPAYLSEAGPPWVLVTLSSLPQPGETALARSALHALSGHQVRVLVTISDGHAREELGPVPDNARVESFAPHSQVLQRSCLSISHAGHGIVARSLYHGVPMVLVPWDRDQPGVAYRAARAGTAEVVTREDLTDERLAEAVAKVLKDPSYRQSAAGFSQRLQSQNPVSAACDLIEQSFAAV